MREPQFSVSIFYPCYEDWGTIGSMVLLSVRTADMLGLDYEITLVDDGSGPQTQEVLQEIKKTFRQVRVVRHEKNRGYGGALRTGFASGTKEWIFYTDGDAQYDVCELTLLLEKAGPDVDVVQGFKMSRNDPIHRIIIGRVWHHFVRIAFNLHVQDVDCDFRLIRRSVFEKVNLESDSGAICAELMVKLEQNRFRIVEVPVHHYARAHGGSTFFNMPRILRTFRQFLGLWVKLILRRQRTNS